jgi:hypothetical protein
MSQATAINHPSDAKSLHTPSQRALYGLCVVVALAFLLAARATNDSALWVQMNLPLATGTMLLVCLAGVEFRCYLQNLALKQAAQAAELDQVEQSALHRQHLFNAMWQTLADSRGQERLPESVMQGLASLFPSDLLAVWSAENLPDTYRLRGVYPAVGETPARLDKVAHVSPCFQLLQERKKLTHFSSFARPTSPAMVWFCEENGLEHVVMCPVLVRQELVGVLAFFSRQEPKIPSKLAEEMQSAANLFLCAL